MNKFIDIDIVFYLFIYIYIDIDIYSVLYLHTSANNIVIDLCAAFIYCIVLQMRDAHLL